jgi:tRNA uridine 5-carboxymethylaminomethyl modification enzyme
MIRWDLIVVGAGHAGCEAAATAARLGKKTLLLSSRLDAIARMSCNPAVGGVGKGHLVREVDALGGLIGRVTDRAGIQFRLLNRSQGSAVRGPRAQCDKGIYQLRMEEALREEPTLELREGQVVAFHVEQGMVAGVVVADGGGETKLLSRAVVLAAGTFLRGVLHFGLETSPGGRVGEPPSGTLSGQMLSLGLRLGRFKTGTPARVDRDSIEFSRLDPQPGDEHPELFHFRHRLDRRPPELPQIVCHLTRTNERVHETIRANLDRSPLYAGRIEGIGPRYCPSIEDKVVRFPDRTSHVVYVEPEGLDTRSTYLNGVSTSLPADVQERFLRQIPGLEEVKLLRPGYAVEYDVLAPNQLEPTLEVRALPGLFSAGQTNGTSGYEEAAAQGIWAGINAVRALEGEPPFRLGREEAYTGVLVDDLVRHGTDEPYRIFTSRAEFRLLLGCDSVLARLLPKALAERLLPEPAREAALRALERESGIDRSERLLRERTVSPSEELLARFREVGGDPFGEPRSLWELLRRPGTDLEAVEALLEGKERGELASLDDEGRETLSNRARYSGYIEKMREGAARLEEDERTPIPPGIDYSSLSGLSRECAEKFARIEPRTIGAAGRIAGVTPAAITVIRIELARRRAGGGRAVN